MHRLIFLILFISLFYFPSFAQAPADYYSNAVGKTGSELKAALHNKIKGHTTFPYTSSSTDVWDILKVSDRDPNNSSNVILFYTGWSVNASQEYNGGSGWNREHVWAKSHGDFGETQGPGTDCHHLRPSDISVNEARGNYYFDNAGTEYIDPTGVTACFFDDARYVWEPRDVEKGDAARMIFYMATRYEGEDGYPNLEVVDYIPTNLASPLFGDLSTLIEWNALDPVDAFEMNRNNVVYSYQNNRNPFIDHPEYVEMIWGTTPPPVNILPTITNITHSPSFVFPTDAVSISANASDADGSLDSVKLYWGISANSMQDSILMSLSGDNYTASMPPHTQGTTVYFKIAAWDNNHAKTISITQNFTVQFVNELPVLSNVGFSPALPTSNDKIEVSATASDPDGSINSVNLYWGVADGEFTNALGMNLTNDKYSANIPAQPAGTEVFFRVIAWDNLDSMSISETQNFIVSEASTLSVKQYTQVSIYPNPASSQIFVEHQIETQIVIYSIDGRKQISTTESIIDVSQLSKGLYFLQIFDKDTKVIGIGKFIIE